MDIMKKLAEAVLDGEAEIAAEAAQEIVDEGRELQPVINQLTETMRVLGKQFENFEIFLPEMMMSADAMVAAMDIFSPVLAASGASGQKAVVLFGAAPGDMHEIGKNIVCTVLKAEGYQVVDLGPNIAAEEFVAKAAEHQAAIIAISALMTTTMQGAAEVIKLLNEQGRREAHKVIVGGAPTNADWAASIGADGWSENASEAAILVNKLMGYH